MDMGNGGKRQVFWLFKNILFVFPHWVFVAAGEIFHLRCGMWGL